MLLSFLIIQFIGYFLLDSCNRDSLFLKECFLQPCSIFFKFKLRIFQFSGKFQFGVCIHQSFNWRGIQLLFFWICRNNLYFKYARNHTPRLFICSNILTVTCQFNNCKNRVIRIVSNILPDLSFFRHRRFLNIMQNHKTYNKKNSR